MENTHKYDVLRSSGLTGLKYGERVDAASPFEAAIKLARGPLDLAGVTGDLHLFSDHQTDALISVRLVKEDE